MHSESLQELAGGACRSLQEVQEPAGAMPSLTSHHISLQ